VDGWEVFMPAIISHDTFAREVYGAHFVEIGESRDECQAFLLGAQGPDVLFYGSVNPVVVRMGGVGSTMHKTRPTDLLAQFIREAAAFSYGESLEDANIARAYTLGFLCHYELDSAVHPLVYAQQRAFCAAGVPGLDDGSAHEVHATIESELDELVLTCKRNETIATFDPSTRILQASPHVLDVVSALYVSVVREVYGQQIGPDAFKRCVLAFRQVQRIVYSESGIKRAALGRFETLFRRHSFLRALSHQNRKVTQSIFDNHEHFAWYFKENDETVTASFWEIYEDALMRALADVRAFASAIDCSAGVSAAKQIAHTVTQGKNFHGVLAEAVVVDGPARPKAAPVSNTSAHHLHVCYNL
jgi:hypothetical protein